MSGVQGTDIVGAMLEALTGFDVLLTDLRISRIHHTVSCSLLVSTRTEWPKLHDRLLSTANSRSATFVFDNLQMEVNTPLQFAPYIGKKLYVATLICCSGISARILANLLRLLLTR